MRKAEANPAPVSTRENIPVVFNKLWISSENTVRVILLCLHPRTPSLPSLWAMHKTSWEMLAQSFAVKVIAAGVMLLCKEAEQSEVLKAAQHLHSIFTYFFQITIILSLH